MPDDVKELRDGSTFPVDVTPSEEPPTPFMPRFQTAYEVARSTHSDPKPGEPCFMFSIDKEKIAAYLRELADRITTEPRIVPQTFQVLSRAANKEYAMTILNFEFAEKQRER